MAVIRPQKDPRFGPEDISNSVEIMNNHTLMCFVSIESIDFFSGF